MTARAVRLCDEHDRLFQKYGGTLSKSKAPNPRCGYPAIMEYVRKNNESLPLSLERMKQIEMLLSE